MTDNKIINSKYAERLAFIRDGLAALRQLESQDKISSRGNHNFRLKCAVPLAWVETFEARNNIRLPEDYRDFLLYLGTAGAGPGYGLDDLFEESCDGYIKKGLSNPFPHTSAWQPGRPVDVPAGRVLNLDYYGAKNWNDDEADKHIYWLNDGAIRIGCEGCDIYYLLVVSGPEYGHMWHLQDDSWRFTPYSSLNHSNGRTGRISFLDWYEHWVRALLEQNKVGQ